MKWDGHEMARHDLANMIWANMKWPGMKWDIPMNKGTLALLELSLHPSYTENQYELIIS